MRNWCYCHFFCQLDKKCVDKSVENVFPLKQTYWNKPFDWNNREKKFIDFKIFYLVSISKFLVFSVCPLALSWWNFSYFLFKGSEQGSLLFFSMILTFKAWVQSCVFTELSRGETPLHRWSVETQSGAEVFIFSPRPLMRRFTLPLFTCLLRGVFPFCDRPGVPHSDTQTHPKTSAVEWSFHYCWMPFSTKLLGFFWGGGLQ